MVQWVKELVLSLQWLGAMLWRGFDPWPDAGVAKKEYIYIYEIQAVQARLRARAQRY